jgi:hypothetical protein
MLYITEIPQNRWGAPIGPSPDMGDPGFAFRVILPAFLESLVARNTNSNAFSIEKPGIVFRDNSPLVPCVEVPGKTFLGIDTKS